jgi:hypothetical protein
MLRRLPPIGLRRPGRLGLSASLPLIVLLVGASCDGPGNSGKTSPDPGLVEAVPWLNGVLPAHDATGQTIVPQLPMYPSVGLGLPDLGSRPANCSVLDGYEFAPGGPMGWFDTFELTTTDPGETGVAQGWSSYDDLTKFAFHTPGDATWYPGLSPEGVKSFYAPWGLPADRFPGPACDGKPNDWVMHFKGGLFRKWGGGISHALTDPVGRYRPSPSDPCPPDVDFCPAPIAADAPFDSVGLPTAGIPTKDDTGKLVAPPYLQSHDFFDVSKYDGVAFWARRGPDGQNQSFVILTDKFTSGRLARENQTFCRRVRECHTMCLSGAPCTPGEPDMNGKPVYRCFDPTAGQLPAMQASQIPVASQLDLMFPRCGPSACTSPSSYQDRDFDDKACTRYTFPAADESGEFCYDPGKDQPPPSRDDRCQDGWTTTIELTPDWKFYALPWSQFGQGGFGKKAPYMDLKSIDTIAFGATMGWADAYFDNVTLYRRKK